MRIKQSPEDFVVHEILGQPLSGHGQHTYFYVEKQGLNTETVAVDLARSVGLAPHDIGYAGRKDKHAITRQWFSMPGREGEAPADWPLQHPQLRCLQVVRHGQKLRRGQLWGNHFHLRLCPEREVDESEANKPEVQIDASKLRGRFANRFGDQRFAPGVIERASDWILNRRQRRITRHRQGWYLSVLRSFLFNEVLQYRELHGDLGAVAGDVLVDGVPTGPLWGRGRSPVSAQAAEYEHLALAPYGNICEALEFAGVKHARRPLTAMPRSLSMHLVEDKSMHLAFALPAGCYATSLLSHWFTVKNASSPSPGRCEDENVDDE